MSNIEFKLAIKILTCIDNDIPFKAANGCTQSIPTVAVVDACPHSKEEWEKAEEKKQCYQITQNCTPPEKFTYHCLPNKSLDHLVEVCAPVQNIVGKFKHSFIIRKYRFHSLKKIIIF